MGERVCRFPGCRTILNSYNSGDTCLMHSKVSFAGGIEATREKVRNVFVRGKASDDFRTEIEEPDGEFLESLKGLSKPNRIFSIVAKAYGVDVETMKKSRRARKAAWARHVVAYILYVELGRNSQEEIAGLTSSTIPSVRHSIRAVLTGMRKTGGEVENAVEKIREFCN